jgi:hypothetical protein
MTCHLAMHVGIALLTGHLAMTVVTSVVILIPEMMAKMSFLFFKDNVLHNRRGG